MAGGFCLSLAGANAQTGAGGDRTGAGDGGERAAQVVESGGAGARECAPGVRAIEQRLSFAGPVPTVPSAADGAGARQRLSPARVLIAQVPLPEVSSKTASTRDFGPWKARSARGAAQLFKNSMCRVSFLPFRAAFR